MDTRADPMKSSKMCPEKQSVSIWDEDLEQHWWRTLDLLELLRET